MTTEPCQGGPQEAPASDDSELGRLNDALHLILDDLDANELKPLAAYLAGAEAWASEIASFHADALARQDVASHWPAPARDTHSGPDAGLERVGAYRILRVLGRGGQGVVYLAEDSRLRRRVALKVLADHAVGSADAFRRFHREARITSRLDHPGICAVYEAGSERGLHYIAMRFIEGAPLWERIGGPRAPVSSDHAQARGSPRVPSTWNEIAEDLLLVERVARALEVAHSSGVIHRDIKPGNILVGNDGQPVLVDFGLARTLDTGADPMTRTAQLGTPQYMSPEQLVPNATLDARTDVYSLGVTLYEVLTGRRPFDGVTPEVLSEEIRASAPLDPRVRNRALPRDLAIVIETCLQKDRNHRYRTALDLAEDLRRVREHEPIRARPTPLPVRVWRWYQGHRALGTALAVAVALLATGIGITSWLLFEWGVALGRFEQMKDSYVVRELEASERTLWPRREGKVERMASWLAESTALQQRRAMHEKALSVLRESALPYDEAQLRREEARRREAYPELYARLVAARSAVEWEQDYLAIHDEETKRLQQQMEEAVADEDRRTRSSVLDQHLAKRAERLQALASSKSRLTQIEADPRLHERLVYAYPERLDQWRDEVIADLNRRLAALPDLMDGVRGRMRLAKDLAERTLREDSARRAWAECVADVARADSPYHGLTLQPEEGLLPLGVDADSGLWEFWHVESGTHPRWEAAAARTSSEATVRGKVRLDEETGIVLVLLPCGTFTMGASAADGAENHDAAATELDGPLHLVTVSPFWIGKFEVTQTQWFSLMQANPSRAGRIVSYGIERHITGRDPVENLSWEMAQEGSRRWGLVLPTEAQWEYACRAGTQSAFWCGDTVASIGRRQAGNILDATAQAKGWDLGNNSMEVTDGHVVHAEVGSFAPNRFGLHDVLGNVREFCRDGFGAYRVSPRRPSRNGDVESDQGEWNRKVVRGGGFRSRGEECGSGIRQPVARPTTAVDLGFRVALPLQRGR